MMNFALKIDECDQYIPTLNCMGYMSTSLDEIQRAFVEDCLQHTSGFFCDIGCGYGVATVPLINQECYGIACDLDERHLEILKKGINSSADNLRTIAGHFPGKVRFEANIFDTINMSMVLHFLSPAEIETAFKEMLYSLKPGGHLYLTTSSPYQRTLQEFIPLYEQRRGQEEWPGFIPDIGLYVPHRAHLLPKRNIVFCKGELSRIASKFGFQVQEAVFFSREGIPSDLSLDGREYSGIICEKPKD